MVVEHYKNCDCITCTMPELAEFIEEDVIGQKIMDERLAMIRRRNTRISRKNNHWASDCWYTCILREWLKWHGAVPTNPDYNSDILDTGEDVERRNIMKFLQLGEYLWEGEHILIDEDRLKLPITGKIDLNVLEGDIEIVVEIKSRKDFGESYDYDAWKKLLPSKEHVAQLTMYLKYTGAPYGYIYYTNKNRSIDTRYKVKFSQKFYDKIVEKLKILEERLGQPEPGIPAGFVYKKFPCSWYSSDKKRQEPVGTCPFYSHCWEGKEIELRYKKLTFKTVSLEKEDG